MKGWVRSLQAAKPNGLTPEQIPGWTISAAAAGIDTCNAQGGTLDGSSADPALRPVAMRHGGVRVPLVHLFGEFLTLGLTAFGGPAMVAYIRRMAVEKKRWLGADVFDGGVALCQAIPGATAMQTAQ